MLLHIINNITYLHNISAFTGKGFVCKHEGQVSFSLAAIFIHNCIPETMLRVLWEICKQGSNRNIYIKHFTIYEK